MGNLHLYNLGRSVPQEACKEIKAGRLKGMTDINPMWRIKKLTELFGSVGFGWYYEINKQWKEEGADGTVSVFCNISLYVKFNDEWSKPIEGTGGSTFVAKEAKGLYTSDEAYKMALTDALSVSCKALGIGADIYYTKDRTKYTDSIKEYKCCSCGKEFLGFTNNKTGTTYSPGQVYHVAKSKNTDGEPRCMECAKKLGFLKVKEQNQGE